MSNDIIPVVLSGGSGSRLWPLSRQQYPKQFLSLTDERSLLQDTLERVKGLNYSQNIVICNEEHRFLVAEQLRESNLLQTSSIILEPTGKNTAPAIALAAFNLLAEGNDALLLILAADHVITENEKFISAIKKAIPYANDGKLVTFGIKPLKPEIGYGYIYKGDELEDNVFKIAKFVEKPTYDVAVSYLASERYFWNSGIFLFRSSAYLKQLCIYAPDIYEQCRIAISQSMKDMNFIRPEPSTFSLCESISIDYAVMEHTEDGVMVITDMDWNDVGSWSSLWDISPKCAQGNYIFGDVVHHNTSNSYIYSANGLVATVGIDNLIVVNTKDALLVASKDKVQDVKTIYERLNQSGRIECLSHTVIYRPWGFYECLDKGVGFEVRKIVVKPKEKIELQQHFHRAEHWTVLKGTAQVTKGDKSYILTENESTYIPIGEVHSVLNPGSFPLEIIEIRTGSYLFEDDNYHVENP
ncbi:mannose-1-phosphate guanylyltransferase/mannose-6-phosphate isomerase [Escherichia albertii]|nr:mannose-1-phosphate guanylyltransferase/mannose-6-phosphate isomerase [Escherichia albertii]